MLCDALVGLTLMAILGVAGQPRGWLLLYAWHPLLMLESAAGAHVDFAGVLALTLG